MGYKYIVYTSDTFKSFLIILYTYALYKKESI